MSPIVDCVARRSMNKLILTVDVTQQLKDVVSAELHCDVKRCISLKVIRRNFSGRY